MSVYSITLRQLSVWEEDGRLSDDNEYLGELALNLAQVLDGGAGLAQAAVANQYRAAMDAIRKTSADDSDAEFDKFLSGLGTPSTSPLGNSS